MTTLKKLFAAFLAMVMTVSVFSLSAAEALADGSVTFRAYYGYGKTHGTANLLSGYTFNEGNTLVEAGDGCSLIGTLPSAQSLSATTGATNRFDMPNIGTYSSIDIYIGGVKTSFPSSSWSKSQTYYRDSSNHLSTATSGTKTVTIAKSGTICCQRWFDISYDTVVVFNYTSQNTVTINTNDSGAGITSAAPSYYFDNTTAAGTATLRVDGSYSSSTGISASVSGLSNAPSSIVFNVGGNTAVLSDTSATKYLNSSCEFVESPTSGSDILKYDNGTYTFYKVSSDITVDYSYTNATYTATFMSQGQVYDTVTDIPGGTTIAAPAANPEMDHYIFTGWYTDVTLTTPAVFPFAMDADTTFYAGFTLAYEVSFNGFTRVTSANWTDAGGFIDAENNTLLTTGYSNAAGAQVQANFDLNLGNIASVEIAFGGTNVTLTGSEAYNSGLYIAADGTTSATASQNDLMKYAYTDGNGVIFLRLYDVNQNISVTLNQTDEAHTVHFSGVRTIASSEWVSVTGGGIDKTNPKLSVPGGFQDDATGVAIGVYTDTNMTITSMVITYGDKTFTLGNELVTDPASGSIERYLLSTGGIQASKAESTTLIKYAHSSSSGYYNFRFYRITRDITINVKYAELAETVTAALVDPDNAVSAFNMDVSTAGTVKNGYTVTIPSAELLGHNDGSVRFVIGPRDSMMEGITITADDGYRITYLFDGTAFIGDITDDLAFTGAYERGFGKIAISYVVPSDGYGRYYVRILNLYQNISIAPIIRDAGVASQNSDITMGVEVGNTLTARFYAEITPEITAAAYDNIIFRAQLGTEEPQDLTGTEAGEKLVFAFEDILAQCMGDEIKGSLIGIKDDTEHTIDTIPSGISIAEYCNIVRETYPGYDKLGAFMANMLNYGSEVQKYIGYNTSDLAISSCAWAGALVGDAIPTVEPGTVISVEEEGFNAALGCIRSAGLNAKEKIGVYFKIYAPQGVEDLRLTVNDYEKPITLVEGNTYRAMMSRITPAGYDTVYTAKLYSGETLLQTVTYSVNTYCARMYENGSNTSLVTAIYNYGLAAENYTR
ncbi:MAG: InlB B-repeat-containing protein [Lachnospiraceae bacterium]|nr:InlB B-repeat-containing protein [Lachnospiraceae bacterium]